MVIQGTKDIPRIILDHKTGVLRLGGTSAPENAGNIFLPVIRWIRKYGVESDHKMHIEFSFTFLNSASTYIISRIIKLLDKMSLSGKEVEIIWYYSTGDYDIKELGDELLYGVTCNHSIIEKEIG